MIFGTLYSFYNRRRKCYFQDEGHLRFFKSYTQVNCELECLTNHTLTKCGCVKFYMPRNSQTRVCGIAKLSCCNDAETELIQMKFKGSLERSGYKKQCDCLPSCTTISYDAEISQAGYDFKSQFLVYRSEEMEDLYSKNSK